MNHKLTLVVIAVIIMAAIPIGIIMSENSNANVSVDDTISGSGFTTTSDGTLHVPLKITTPLSDPQQITITVTDSNGNPVASAPATIPAGDYNASAPSIYTLDISFRLSSAGSHTLTVTCTPKEVFQQDVNGNTIYANWNTVTINVTQNIWSKTSTYAAIIVVVILIVIAIYLHMRNAPVKKPDTTFTDLERQKKESKGEVEEAPKTSATERKRYKSSGSDGSPKPKEAAKSSKTSAPPEEKKAATFTELEKQKSEKKAVEPKSEPKKDDSSSGEPKKIKYVSSRRK